MFLVRSARATRQARLFRRDVTAAPFALLRRYLAAAGCAGGFAAVLAPGIAVLG